MTQPIYPNQVAANVPLLPGWPEVLQEPLRFFQTLARENPDLARRLGLEDYAQPLPPGWTRAVQDPIPVLTELNRLDPQAVERLTNTTPSTVPTQTSSPELAPTSSTPQQGELVKSDDPSALPTPAVLSAPRRYNRWVNFAREHDIFRVHYVDRLGRSHTFAFSLLPAIESNLTMGSSAPNIGGYGARVPEVKPGLLDRISMKYVRRGVAGAPPAIQSMGIEQRIWQLVGAYLGNEQPEGPEHPGAVYPPNGSFPEWRPVKLNAYEVARFFTEEIIMVGRPVNFSLLSYRPDEDDVIEMYFRGVIQSCRHLHARSDRTYYAFDILITEYYNPTQWAENNARTYTSGPAVVDPAAGSKSQPLPAMPEVDEVVMPQPFRFRD